MFKFSLGEVKIVCWLLAVIAIAGMLLSQRAASQVTTGSISGVVADPSGAVLAGADVAVKDLGTNITRTVKTNASGLYQAPDLPVGQYEVSVRMAGFKTMAKTGIVLTVGAANVQNFTLVVGSETQVVEVQAQAAQVETASSELGALVNPQQMQELPLNGQNYEQLILLAPGVVPVASGTMTAFYGRSDAYSVSGSRPVGQTILLDGTDIQNFWGHGSGSASLGTSLGVDAIAEFTILTNTYSSEFGGSGSAINMVSKSGANQLHGSAYEFLRNQVFDVRNYFDEPNGPPSFRRNQFGGSIGGPIRKDKTFIFANYEGLVSMLGETGITTVPDAAHHTDCEDGLGTVIGCELMALFPAPNLPNNPGQVAGTGQLSAVGNKPTNENYLLARVDHQLSAKDSLFGRVVIDRGQLVDPFPNTANGGNINGWPETDRSRNTYVTIEEKRLAGTHLVNVARFSFTRINQGNSCPQSGLVTDIYPGTGKPDAMVSFLGILAAPIGPNISCPMKLVQNKFTPEDQVYWTHGAHDIRFGGFIRRDQTEFFNNSAGSNTWDFAGPDGLLNAGAPGSGALAVGPIPGPVGTPGAAGYIPDGDIARRDFRDIEFAAYIQDNWKVRRNFTVNIGLRWEPTTIATGTNLNDILDPLTAPAVSNTDPLADYTHVTQAMGKNPSMKNFDPRIGFAYSPFAGKKSHETSIRAGFGMFHEVLEARSYSEAYQLADPYVSVVAIAPTFPIAFTLPICPPGPPFGCLAYSNTETEGLPYYNTHTPYNMQWNLNIQQQLTSGLVFTIGYIGSRADHLLYMADANPILATKQGGRWVFDGPICPFPGCPQPRLNNNVGYWTESEPVGSSNYNGLQLSANGRIAKSLSLQVFYTYSKSLDDSSNDTIPMGFQGSPIVSNPYDPRYEYGPSTFDVRNNLTANLIWTAPFHGSKWVEGFQLSLIPALHSGVPYSAIIGSDYVGSGSNNPVTNERPDEVGNPNVGGQVAANPTCEAPATVHNVHNWYNPCAFVLPPPYTLGNEGRNSLRAPGYADVDFAVQKTTSVSERLKIQLRAEFFNIINHTNLTQPSLQVFETGPTGTPAVPNVWEPSEIINTVGTSRQIQFALKFLF
jgi:hypothetical protein